MRYKFHLFMRGAKHFNQYEKRSIHSHHHSRRLCDFVRDYYYFRDFDYALKTFCRHLV